MRVIAIVQNMFECTAYLKNGTSVKFPVDSVEALTLIKAIPDLAIKGEVDVDIVANNKKFTSTLEDVAGIQFFCILQEVAERLKKDPALIDDLNAISRKYLGKLATNETLVAKKDDKIIVGAERLNKYIKKAEKLQQYEGLKALLERCFAMTTKPNHTVEDLLDFLENADLPVADDGSIIAYKAVNKDSNFYTDCHTGLVKQKIGSRVFMKPEMVDPDRSNECSQGLHIARRGYLKHFYGQALLLVKFNPEDVIAVPNYDHNKIRVSSYEILAELPATCKKLIYEDQPMTSLAEGKKLLAKAINCQFPAPKFYTEIRGPMGRDCVYGKLDAKGNVIPEREVSDKEASALDDNATNPATAKKNVNVSKDLLKKTLEIQKKAKEVEHPMQELREIFESPKLTTEKRLYAEALRKRLRKSWDALGIDPARLL